MLTAHAQYEDSKGSPALRVFPISHSVQQSAAFVWLVRVCRVPEYRYQRVRKKLNTIKLHTGCIRLNTLRAMVR